MLRLTSCYFLLLALFSVGCGGSSSTQKKYAEEEKQAVEFTRDNLEDCIKKELYYDTRVDLGSYENLKTEYFTELRDYSSNKALRIEDELDKHIRFYRQKYERDPQESIPDSVQFDERVKLKFKIDSMGNLLRPYPKEVVGYVFVHTFKTMDDTMAVIFLMDKYCMKTEAIPIKISDTDIDPDHYRRLLSKMK
ncbi:MAG: hypothetical protein COA57_05485 [Flavobacteriales bacterium]|nr:MAG: hypothetical protein COA57_05485 [Flavobacteriales bacterium]